MEKRIPEPSDGGYDSSSLTTCLGELLKSGIILPCYTRKNG